MAICEWCKQEMSTANGCVGIVTIMGRLITPIRYGNETRNQYSGERCHDCNVKRGRYHHPGCDVEECPGCHGQLISCGCLDDGDEDGCPDDLEEDGEYD